MVRPPDKPRTMLDANILLAGSAFPRWPYEVLQHAIEGGYRLVLCPLVIKQAQEHIRERFPQHLHRFESFLDETDYELVPNPTQAEIDDNQNLVRDLSDVAIALAAISAKVDYLVSEDKDLTTQDESTAQLRRRLKVMLAGTFLRQVMGWTSDELESIRYRKWDDLAEVETEEARGG